MKIWMFNNYNMLPEHGPMNRHYYFGKQMKEMGHEPVVFVGSHPHNTDVQLLEGSEKYRVFQEEPFPWVLVKTCKYGKSRKKQVLSMFQFYFNGRRAAAYAAERYGRPDVILGSSAHPLAALLAVRLGKKYGCRAVVEVRDLWPESLVALGIAGARNPAVIALRILEKWLYRHADAVIFTQEGAYDYIAERGWEREVPRSKVFYINNGVDLAAFDYSREHDRIEDPDLEEADSFRVVYTGSIRLGNGLRQLVDCAEQLRDYTKIKFLAYGGGGELEELRTLCRERRLSNLVFKGPVPKREIPFILSRSSLNLLNYDPRAVNVYRFGSSQNKLFDYLASGKPILSNVKIAHSIPERHGCGITSASPEGADYAEAVLRIYRMPSEEYQAMCRAARAAAEEYDFKNLTEKLLHVLEGRGSL